MNTIDIVRGILSGYGLRALQIVATLVVVPFILSYLGTDRYGRIFTILSAMGIMTLASDGLRLAFSRSIAQAISNGPTDTARQLGGGLKAVLLLALSMAAPLYFFSDGVLAVLGVPVEAEYQLTFLLALVYVVQESGAYCFGTYLTARGRIDFFNALIGIQVIVRNVAFVLYFSQYAPRADAYMAIWLAGAVVSNGVLVSYAITRWPEDFRGVLGGRVREAWGAVRYSLPLTIDSAQHYILNQFSIPLVNRFIGSTEAALLALAINTIGNNLAQILFTVTRPLLVPVASRLDLKAMGPATRQLLLNIDSIFSLCAFATMMPLIAAMPTIIALWLGDEYADLVLPSQILIVGTALYTAFSVRRSLLIGQGFGGAIVRASFPLIVLSLVAMGWALGVAREWIWVTVVIAVFSGVSSFVAVGLVFERALLTPESTRSRGALRRTITGGVAGVLAIYVSQWAPRGFSLEVVPLMGALFVFVLAMAHVVMIPARDVIDTLKRLKKGARKSLFAAPSADEGPTTGT